MIYYSWSSGTPGGIYNRLSPLLAGFQAWVQHNFGGNDLGGYHVRKIDGSSKWSPHAFGAAWDWGATSRATGLRVVDMVIANPEAFGIQSIHDYQGGRIWHVGRGWKPYNFPAGDRNDTHFHFEVARDRWESSFTVPTGGGNAAIPDVLSREQTAQIAYQAGFRGQALVNMVAIAGRESSYRPSAHRTDRNPDDMSGDMGLWQINYVHHARLKAAGIINSPRDLFDPVVNARAAFFLSNGGSNLQPWTAGPGGWTAGGNPLYGTDVRAAQAAVENARTQGLLGQQWSAGGSIPGLPGAPGPGVGPMELPRDAQLVRTGRGLYALFNLGKGVFISYKVPGDGSVIFDRSEVQRMTDGKMQERYGRPVEGGSAHELGAIADEWGTYRSFWENVLIEHIGLNNPARNDPGVRRVLAQAAARPDMSDAELRNRLEGTRWWKRRTETELAWNDLSPAEQRKRRQDTAVQMAQTIYQLTGQKANMQEVMKGRWIEDVASGKVTLDWWTESVVKRRAEARPNSPWSRSLRDEEEAKRQRGVDIENTANQIKDTLGRWGLRWTGKTIDAWAKGIMEKTKSDEDLMEAVKNQAATLFPWKDREMETETAAQPWLQAFSSLMEREGTLFTPRIQKALQQGQSAWDFEQDLKRSAEYATTKNGQAAMYDTMDELGGMLDMLPR